MMMLELLARCPRQTSACRLNVLTLFGAKVTVSVVSCLDQLIRGMFDIWLSMPSQPFEFFDSDPRSRLFILFPRVDANQMENAITRRKNFSPINSVEPFST
jgi:hypothetical protein